MTVDEFDPTASLRHQRRGFTARPTAGHWAQMLRDLPPVLSVRAQTAMEAMVGPRARPNRRPKSRVLPQHLQTLWPGSWRGFRGLPGRSLTFRARRAGASLPDVARHDHLACDAPPATAGAVSPTSGTCVARRPAARRHCGERAFMIVGAVPEVNRANGPGMTQLTASNGTT